MNRTTIINSLAKKINAKSYLEIGVRRHSDNFDKINIDHKVGVDPCLEVFDREPTYKLKSDEYFSSHNETFDLISFFYLPLLGPPFCYIHFLSSPFGSNIKMRPYLRQMSVLPLCSLILPYRHLTDTSHYP